MGVGAEHLSSGLILALRNVALIVLGAVSLFYLFVSLLPIVPGGYSVSSARLVVELPDESSRIPEVTGVGPVRERNAATWCRAALGSASRLSLI